MAGEGAQRRKSAGMAAADLVDAHGAEGARRAALAQQRKARRARSRSRFDFWAAVVAGIEAARAERVCPGAPGHYAERGPAETGALE